MDRAGQGVGNTESGTAAPETFSVAFPPRTCLGFDSRGGGPENWDGVTGTAGTKTTANDLLWGEAEAAGDF